MIRLHFEPLKLKTAHPFGISYGTTSDISNVLVKLSFKDMEGLGEAAPAEYHDESPETVQAVLGRWQASDILGDDPFAIVSVMRRLDKDISGHRSAKAAVEMALLDLMGKTAGLPAFKLLGLAGLEPPMTDFTIGIDRLHSVEKKTREALDKGFKLLKVKQGTDYDREIIKTIRKVAPDIPVRVDANGGWSPKVAIEMSGFLAENGVEFIEQPLPKHAGYSDFKFVRDRSALPILLDETICTSKDVAKMAGAIDGVVVKLAKAGGILEAMRVIHAARAHQMQVMFGCMVESSIGVTAAVHLSALCDHLDLDGAMLLAEDPYDGAYYDHGYMRLPDRPGLGVIQRK